jgi:hypothetical protein
MNKYKVTIAETTHYTYELEAEDDEEAGENGISVFIGDDLVEAEVVSRYECHTEVISIEKVK